MIMNKKALITGISGQDGSYLAELLLEKGYEVHGIIRRHSVAETQTSNIEHIRNDLHLHYGDLTDYSSLEHIVKDIKPDEVYNLAAMSHVAVSFQTPYYTGQATGLGVLNLLEAVRNNSPESKIYQASSSEMFGNSVEENGTQNERTCKMPVSPYGISKLFAFEMVRCYRNSYHMFGSNGILFNHESVRRGTNFVTQKVIKSAVNIKLGKEKELILGNLDAKRDWGHAKDYVKAMHLMLQHDKPDDFVIATGKPYSIRQLCSIAFGLLHLDYHDYVKQDPKFMRPNELDYLCGDASKAKTILNWKPEVFLPEIIQEMIEYHIENAKGKI